MAVLKAGGEKYLRSACGAAVWFSVITAIGNIFIFAETIRAHPENIHNGLAAVIRQGLDDCIAGTAVGTVDKRIVISSVFRGEKLPAAIRAKGCVRCNQRHLVVTMAWTDCKAVSFPFRSQGTDVDVFDHGHRWWGVF